MKQNAALTVGQARSVGLADPREVAAAKVLADQVLARYGRRNLNQRTLEEAQRFVDAFQRHARTQGVDLPAMKVLAFPVQGTLEVVRADLTREALNGLVIKLTQRYARMEMGELAASIRRAFPHFYPDRARPDRDFRPLLVH